MITTSEFIEACDQYEERFCSMFTNIDMTPEETVKAIKEALESGVPYDGSVPEGCII